MSGSISFDWAAEFYDETRALQPELAAAVTDAILHQLAQTGADRLFEVGAGTGRIAYPLVQRGLPVTALDISRPMLSKFRAKLTPADAADFVLGDATRLPLRDGCAPAILVVHVLHLITDWQRAMSELHRILAPGGVILRQAGDNDFEALPEHRQSEAAWRGILASHGYTPRKRAGIQETNGWVRSMGGSVRTIELGTYAEPRSEAGWIEEIRERIHSNLWEIPDEIYPRVGAEYEAWARAHFGDLTVERPVNYRYTLDVWSFG